jgi:sugar phosphate isomerase/epimerase
MVKLSAFADEISADPNEQVACLLENGVRNVELRSVFGKNVLDLDGAQHEAFRDLLRTQGMALSAIGSPIGKISINDPFEPHLERFATALDLAEFYGTPRIRVFSFYLPDGVEPATFRDEVLRRMRVLSDRAEGRGLCLVLENEKGIYGDFPARVAEVIESVGSPALTHAFDPANYLEVGVPVWDAWNQLRPFVTHFHVKDYDPATRKNVPAGQGAGCIGAIIADAVAHGFEGYCVLEPHLVVAEKSYGFTGPARFGEAAHALKSQLKTHGVAYD